MISFISFFLSLTVSIPLLYLTISVSSVAKFTFLKKNHTKQQKWIQLFPSDGSLSLPGDNSINHHQSTK